LRVMGEPPGLIFGAPWLTSRYRLSPTSPHRRRRGPRPHPHRCLECRPTRSPFALEVTRCVGLPPPACSRSFPGYVGSFVQPPQHKETGWTTVLRFDSAAHLEGWLKSDARAAMVKESEDLVQDFHAQRVDTSFPGWVPSDPATGKPPNMWKTACLILLTLFPVVMLELKFLNPPLAALNPAVRTFIGNALSVALTTWPLMPLAIWGFSAWLFPENKPRWLVTSMPIVLVLCYLAEIALLWHLLL
jgi:antibiotic biosynthesis monooxygenase (ABM) superfamily enzyme